MRRFTLISALIGIIIAIVLSMLILLGLRIFVPKPVYPQREYTYKSCPTGDIACSDQQRVLSEEADSKFIEDRAAYEITSKTYSGRIFVAANIVGIIVLIVGLLIFGLKLGTNIAAGIIISGAYGIIYGYVLGWRGADDKLKFIVGVIVAIILIGGGIVVNRMRDRAAQELNQPKV